VTSPASDACIRQAYRFGPARIEVASDDADAGRWLEEFMTPWFTPARPVGRGLGVRLTCSAPAWTALERRRAEASLTPRACFALDREIVELPGWREAGDLVIADDDRGAFYRVGRRGIEIVTRPGARRARVGLMRIVRELGAAHMRARRDILDLHAAAFAVAGRGVLLVGPKQSGKTTLLVAALTSGQASLLANDRVCVDTRGSAPRAFGVPTLVSLRTGTLRWFPSLPVGLPERPSLLHAAELAAQAGAPPADAPPLHLTLSPAQLARRLGAGIAASAPIAAVVFPVISPNCASWSLEEISPEDGAAWLRECLYGVTTGPRARTVFEAAALGTGRGQPPRAQLADRLASRVPLFRCRLGRHAYRDGAQAWLRALPLALPKKR